ncbi:MAG: hypothetical protein ACU0BS_06920 [Hasllibacter sp.]
MIRRGRRLATAILRGPARNRTAPTARDHRLISEATYWTTKAFYLAYLIVAFDCARRIYDLRDTDVPLSPLWPVFWVEWTGVSLAAQVIAVALMAFGLLAVLTRSRLTRAGLFLSFLCYSGLDNSFGSINHYMHYVIWSSLGLIFCPTARHDEIGRGVGTQVMYALPFFLTQGMIAFFYSLSGLWKSWTGFTPNDAIASSFAPEALPLLVMGRWLQTGAEPLFASFFAANQWIAWPAYLLVIYVELFFVVALFRPQMHRVFGAAMAAFHLGVWATMGIAFQYQTMVVAGLFVLSPFAVLDRSTPRERVLQLPLFGDLLALLLDRAPGRRRAGGARLSG